MNLKIADSAPNFELPDQRGANRKLSDFLGKKVLIYFYPRDFTPGCIKEACSIRDAFSNFKKLNTRVLGISKDTIESHKKFADKYNLPFTLLSDPDRKVLKKFGVWQEKKFLGKSYMGIARTSILIDEKRRIIKIYKNVNPLRHVKEVLRDLEN